LNRSKVAVFRFTVKLGPHFDIAVNFLQSWRVSNFGDHGSGSILCFSVHSFSLGYDFGTGSPSSWSVLSFHPSDQRCVKILHYKNTFGLKVARAVPFLRIPTSDFGSKMLYSGRCSGSVFSGSHIVEEEPSFTASSHLVRCLNLSTTYHTHHLIKEIRLFEKRSVMNGFFS